MPRYYFNVRDEETHATIADVSGVELPDLQSVRAEALASARELIIEAIRTKKSIDRWHFAIADGSGNVVLNIPFQEAVTFIGPRLWNENRN